MPILPYYFFSLPKILSTRSKDQIPKVALGHPHRLFVFVERLLLTKHAVLLQINP